VLVACLTTLACAHGGQQRIEREKPGPFRLGIDDVVEVSVYKDPDLTRTVPVRPDGRISLPIVGEVVAAGRTPEEVRAEVVSKLNQYVKDPTVVTFIVHEVRSARFFVIGEVMRPGAYPLRGDMNVLQAIALAGGAGEFSSRDRATIVRAATGERIVLSIDDAKEAGTILLYSGDTVVVR
jgi:polysaccharide export outer membrane protein